jgi:hypothetical protein
LNKNHITYEGPEIFFKVSTEQRDDIKIVVPPARCAILIKDGVMLNTLSSGTYILEGDKSGLFKKKTENSNIDIVFAADTARLKITWGTKYLLDTRDCITGVPIKIGMSGEMELSVANPRKTYLELSSSASMSLEELRNRLTGRIVSEIEPVLTGAMRDSGISYDRLSEYKSQVSAKLLPVFAKSFNRDYGLNVLSFCILRTVIDETHVREIESRLREMYRIASRQ